MATDNERVAIYQGTSVAYERLLASDNIDENGIYFIEGADATSGNSIYVGSQRYNSSTAITSQTLAYTGVFTDPISLHLENVPSTFSLCIIGVFLNGLRAVSECTASVDDNDPTTIIVNPLVSYSNTDIFEIVVDVLVIGSISVSLPNAEEALF